MDENSFNRRFCGAMAFIFAMAMIVIIATVVYSMRGYAPLFDMHNVGVDLKTVVEGAGNALQTIASIATQ